MWMNRSCWAVDSFGKTVTRSEQCETLDSFMPCTVLTEAPYQTRRRFKEGQRMYRDTAVSGRTLGIALHGEAQGDVWISEMLQTDEIPREPAMDNVNPQQWCRNQMENLQISLSFFHTSAHNCSRFPKPTGRHNIYAHMHGHTHTQSLYTPV